MFSILGAAEIIGGYVTGVVRDKTSNWAATILVLVTSVIAVGLLVLFVM